MYSVLYTLYVIVNIVMYCSVVQSVAYLTWELSELKQVSCAYLEVSVTLTLTVSVSVTHLLLVLVLLLVSVSPQSLTWVSALEVSS